MRAATFRARRSPGDGYSLVMACPPNSLRIDASSLSANESLSRERRRSINDCAITGVGTLSSIASSTVQRPSPESGTYGAMPAICGFFCNASA